jgi:hypothetical protein
VDLAAGSLAMQVYYVFLFHTIEIFKILIQIKSGVLF